MKLIPTINKQWLLACLILLTIGMVALAWHSGYDRGYTQETFRDVILNPGESLATVVFTNAAPVPMPLIASRAKTVYLFAISPDFIISLTACLLGVTLVFLILWALVVAKKGNVTEKKEPPGKGGGDSHH